MNRLGPALIGIGLVVALVCGFADPIGIGGQLDDFGWKQIAGLSVGTALIGAGIASVLSETGGLTRGFEAHGPTNDESSGPTSGVPPPPG